MSEMVHLPRFARFADHFRSSPNVGHNQIISLPAITSTGGRSLKIFRCPQGNQVAPPALWIGSEA